MISLPALCDHCGKCFVGEFGGTLDGRISLKGQTVPGCPDCGGNISVPNGKYSFVGSAVRLLARPAIALEDLQALDVLLGRMETSCFGIREGIAEIVDHHTKFSFLGGLFMHYNTSSSQSVQALAGFFRSIIASLKIYWPGRDTDFERFEHSVNEHFLLSWDLMPSEKKDALDGLILAVPWASKNIGTSRMQKLKRVRRLLKKKR